MIITCSRVFRICVLPFHHVIVGAGFAPTTSHVSSYGLFADNGRFSPSNFTHNGRTEMNIMFNLFSFCFNFDM